MAVRGLQSYRNNIFRTSGYSASNQLAKLLGRSSVNGGILKKAYQKLEKNTGKAYLNRTDLSENTLEEFYQSGMTGSAEAEQSLKDSTASMRISSMNMLAASEMDSDEFAGSVKKFAEDYNSTVKTLQKTDNLVAVSSGVNMTNTTRSFAASLEKAGITVNKDNTLTVDENKLRKNEEYAKTLFTGSYSFGGKTAKKASELQSLAQLAGFSQSGIYNRYGLF